MYLSTKTYTPESGLSCAFRQWKATHSHCSKLHGYALGFKFTFAAISLDDRNWVVDFGGLKGLKKLLVEAFDHKLAVANDDPHRDKLLGLHAMGIADVNFFDRVGCEAFAEHACMLATREIQRLCMDTRVWVAQVECFEHQGNGAIFIPDTNLYPGFPNK